MSGSLSADGIIRIVLIEVPKLMAAILTDAIANDPRLEIVATFQSAEALTSELRECDFDVIVTALRPGRLAVAPSIQKVLFDVPHRAVLAFSCRGSRMHMAVRDIAPQQVPEIIRATRARSA